ncbi:stage III sporulation protein AF [Eubacteriales bacterium OttesenSCG-928-G02]|nr:stage III sporulation protein AF [Eubacteriales bacterium OttesenSCG-928-G02]
MKSYFLGLFIASIICGIVSVIASGSSSEKYVKYICSLVCVVMVISPFVDMKISEIDFDYTATEVSGQYISVQKVSQMSENMLINYINEILLNDYGINAADVRINIDSGENFITLTSVVVYLSEENEEFLTSVQSKLSAVIGTGITVCVLR